MKPASCKAKGRALQNHIAKRIRELFALSENDVKPAVMGESGIDIKLSDAARSVFPYAIEAKNVEKLNVWQAWEQAEQNAKKEALEPMLIIKKNGKNPLMVLEMEEGLTLIRKI